MHQLPAQLLLGPLVIVVLQGAAHVLAHLLHGVALADLLSEGVVQLIAGVGADLVDVAVELGGLARQLRGVILGGERDGNGHIVADVGAHQLLLKAGDEHAAAQGQGLLLGGAAGKLDALGKSGIVQHQLVARGGGAAHNGHDTGIGLQEALQLAVDILRRHIHMLQLALQVQIGKAHSVYFLFISCRMAEMRISPATTRSSAEKPEAKLSEYRIWLEGGNSSSPA